MKQEHISFEMGKHSPCEALGQPHNPFSALGIPSIFPSRLDSFAKNTADLQGINVNL
jgi:hypothetical protein